MLDAVLAIVHHLLIFMMLAVLVMEFTLTKDGMRVSAMRRVIRLDIVYGIVAILTIMVGIGRVVWGAKGFEFYLHNVFFWLKMTAFLGVGLCSVPPTLAFLKWRATAAVENNYLPKPEDVAIVRRWLKWELRLFVLIPVFAALMARFTGYVSF